MGRRQRCQVVGIVFILLLTAVFPNKTFAHEPCDISSQRIVGSVDTPDRAHGVAVSGQYAYIADGSSGLQIVDVSNSASPTIVGSVDTLDWAHCVVVSGSYAYIADGWSGLQIIDVSNQASPAIVGSVDTHGWTTGVAVSGQYAYIGDGWSGLQIVDVSNPVSPVIVGSVDTPGIAGGVAVSGLYAYIGDSAAGLQIVDVSNPVSPVIVGSVDTPEWAYGVAVSGSYAYIPDGSPGLQIVDVSNPVSPIIVGSVDTPGVATGVAVSGLYAYIAGAESGLQMVDVSNPVSPIIVGSVDTPDRANTLAVYGQVAYVADEASGLQIVDVSNPVSPVIVGSVSTPNYAYGVAVSGQYAYVADKASGLQIVDVSNPVSPAIVGSVDTPGEAYGVAVSGQYAYVADKASGLQIVDVSNPVSPVIVGSVDTLPNYASGVAVSGQYAYVADSLGLKIVDVSNPVSPVIVGSVDTPVWANGVAVSGQYAYVTDYTGLQIVDVSNPVSPTIVGGVSIGWVYSPRWARAVAVSGQYAYVADGVGLQIVDVSKPVSPIIVGSVDTPPGEAGGVTVFGQYAYLAAGWSGLKIIDVSNPVSPIIVGSVYPPNWAYGVAVSGQYAYVTDLEGLQVIQLCLDVVMTETSSAESALSETLASQDVLVHDLTVSGDFTGQIALSPLQIVEVSTGPFTGNGFFRGPCEIVLDGISYTGTYEGALYHAPQERKIYLRGGVSGEILATVDGYLSESVPGSGMYDRYQADWKIGELGYVTTSIYLTIDASVTHHPQSNSAPTQLHVLQTHMEGYFSGAYSRAVNIVLTHVRIADQASAYFGEGFSSLSFNSESGSGMAWAYSEETMPGVVQLHGLSESPMFGVLSGILNENSTPRNLFLSISRVDMGLPPMADLKVRVWGPARVSPGQTVDYIIEYGNTGLKAADDVVAIDKLFPLTEYVSSTNNGIYIPERHEVLWKLGTLPPNSLGYSSAKVMVQWGVPGHSELISEVAIGTTSEEIDEFLTNVSAIDNMLFYADYQPQHVLFTTDLSSDEFSNELGDPEFSDMFVYSTELGYEYIDVATKVYISSGATMVFAPMVLSGENLVFLVKYSGDQTTSYLMDTDETTISFFDRAGGFTYDTVSDSVSYWGEHHSCTWPQCVNDCIGEKLPRYLLNKALNMLTLNTWTLFWAQADCFGCLVSDPQRYCPACIKGLFKGYGVIRGIPFLGELIELAECMGECKYSPSTHGCNAGDQCRKCNRWFYYPQSFYALWTCGDDCLWGDTILAPTHDCEGDAVCIQLSKCHAECVPRKRTNTGKYKSQVIAAGDPNMKYGPEGNVSAGEKLDYRIEYFNEGEGIAFGVNFTDTLDEDLNDSTLQIGPVLSTADGSEIAPTGNYDPATRTITWIVGEVGPGEGGYADFSVNVRSDAQPGTEIINFGIVYFPSVPEVTRTNGIVSVIPLPNVPPVANAGIDQTVEAGAGCTALVTLDGSGSSDQDSTPGTNDDIASFDWYEGEMLLGSGETFTHSFGFGNHTVTLLARDNAGESSSDDVMISVVDNTPPSLSVPADLTVQCAGPSGQAVDMGEAVASDSCCEATLLNDAPVLFGLGDTLVTWTATDCHGNSVTATQMVHIVYNFSGILQPINADGSSIFKAGQTIPVKFKLHCSGVSFGTAVATLSVAKITSAVTGSVEEVTTVSSAEANTGNIFRYDPVTQQYIYNWSTKGLSVGTYQLRIGLDDGTVHPVNLSLRAK